MCEKRNKAWLLAVLGVLGCLCFLQYAGASTPTQDNVDALAAWLHFNQDQVPGSLSEGSWPPEGGYTGSIVMGLAEAYHHTCSESYREAALLGGEFLREQNDYPPLVYLGYGDDALAFAKLSSISPDPYDNQWRTDLELFYHFVRESLHSEGYLSTSGFISYYFAETKPSTTVFYLAHHAIAAYYVDAIDKEIWRDAVRAYLSQVSDDDLAEYPVWALGAATWALAQTGPLDDTLVKTGGDGELYWLGRTLADLPDLLLSHQKSSGLYNGSFFWRFDHTDGAGGSGPNDNTHGFTEDSIFGVLGLAAALKANPDLPDVAAGISATKSLLPEGIDTDGSVWGHLWEASPKNFHYAGRMLTGLSGVNVDGDVNMSDSIGPEDLFIFALYWLDSCSCLVDFNGDGIINLVDFAMGPAKNWLWIAP